MNWFKRKKEVEKKLISISDEDRKELDKKETERKEEVLRILSKLDITYDEFNMLKGDLLKDLNIRIL